MITELKSEFKKVFTIRSTYIILGFIFLLLVFFSFYIGGWHAQKSDLILPTHFYQVSQDAINFLMMLVGILGMLLFSHEFRYNTAAYTLTLSRSRSKVLWAKIFIVLALSLIVTVIVAIAAPLLALWGVHANHLHYATQHFYYAALVWKGLAYGIGYSMFGFLIAAIIRNQIGAIVAYLIFPQLIEGLLSIWLKANTVYLPFAALHDVLGTANDISHNALTPIHALYVVLGYIAVGLAVSWYLFVKKDV